MSVHRSVCRVTLGFLIALGLGWSHRTSADFVRGDSNADGAVDVSDSILSLSYLFSSGVLPCFSSADANDDGRLDVADAVATLTYLFSGGPPLPPPFPACGGDPTPDALDCQSPPAACAPTYPMLTFAGTNPQGYDEYTLDLDPTVVMILVPGGTFLMGQPGISVATPAHEVTLSPYFISKYEITTAQYRRFCDLTSTPYPPPPAVLPSDYFTNPLFDDYPVVSVSWSDLSSPGGYLEWAGLRLPTEAQWEFASRGFDGRTYPWGSESAGVPGSLYRCNGCWGWSCTTSDGWPNTSPVGQDPFDQYPGPFGTLGQAGNVWEWCQNWAYSYPSTPQIDPTGPLSGSNKVLRGGSWLGGTSELVSAWRSFVGPSYSYLDVGFRPVGLAP